MPRIKLQPQKSYPFSTTITVRITDCNYGGHLGNDALLALLHEARIRFLAKSGFSEKNCGGVSLIMADAVINYRSEAFAGDHLKIKVGAGEPWSHGFRIFYLVTNKETEKVVALAETGMVCFDYSNRTIKQLPIELMETLIKQERKSQ